MDRSPLADVLFDVHGRVSDVEDRVVVCGGVKCVAPRDERAKTDRRTLLLRAFCAEESLCSFFYSLHRRPRERSSVTTVIPISRKCYSDDRKKVEVEGVKVTTITFPFPSFSHDTFTLQPSRLNLYYNSDHQDRGNSTQHEPKHPSTT